MDFLFGTRVNLLLPLCQQPRRPLATWSTLTCRRGVWRRMGATATRPLRVHGIERESYMLTLRRRRSRYPHPCAALNRVRRSRRSASVARASGQWWRRPYVGSAMMPRLVLHRDASCISPSSPALPARRPPLRLPRRLSRRCSCLESCGVVGGPFVSSLVSPAS
jgi:hypothetical protein